MLLNSISRKVLIGYAAIILIVAIVSSVLFTGLAGVNKVTDDFVEKSLPAIQNVNNVNSSLSRLLVSAYGLYGYTIEKDVFESTIDNEFTSLESSLNKIKRNFKLTSQVQFAQLKELLESFKAVMTSGEVDWDEARNSLTKIQDEVSRLESEISQIAQMISKQSNTKTKQITNDVSSMTMWLVLSVMSILLITLGAYFFAKKHIATPVNSLSNQLDKLVENNDLRLDVEIDSNDEVSLTANSINKLLAAFRQVNRDIGQSASIVKDSIELLNHSATLSDSEVDKLSDVVSTMMASSEQLELSIADASSRSEVASEIAQTGAAQVELGKTNISETANIITDLSNDIDNSAEMLLSLKNAGDKVSDVVKTIADIADQTNLLALNAAIEAARAGESGRGFAVVAGEVRTLAKRTHDSTYEINSILEQIVTSISSTVGAMEVNKSKANEAVNAAQTTVDSLKEIQATVLSLSDENKTLANASQASQLDVSRMKQDIDNINVGMSVVSESSGETKAAAATLANLSIELEQAAQQFKT